jgi:hypothetical protein
MKQMPREHYALASYECVNPLCAFPAWICKRIDNNSIVSYTIYFESEKCYYLVYGAEFIEETLVYRIISLVDHLANVGKRDSKDGHNGEVVYSEKFQAPNYESMMKDIPKYFSRMVKLRAFT